jgi:hypothetical protein
LFQAYFHSCQDPSISVCGWLFILEYFSSQMSQSYDREITDTIKLKRKQNSLKACLKFFLDFDLSIKIFYNFWQVNALFLTLIFF